MSNSTSIKRSTTLWNYWESKPQRLLMSNAKSPPVVKLESCSSKRDVARFLASRPKHSIAPVPLELLPVAARIAAQNNRYRRRHLILVPIHPAVV